MNRHERRAAKKDPNTDAFLAAELKKAIDLHQDGKLAGAERIYEKLLEMRDDSDLVWNLYGMIAMQRENLKDAETRFNKAIEIDDAKPIYFKNLGTIHHKQGRFDKAEDMLTRSLRLQPDFEAALSVLGHVYLAKFKYDEAKIMFTKALATNPDNYQAKLGLAEVMMAEGDMDKAEILFKDCINQKGFMDTKVEALLSYVSNIHKIEHESDEFFIKLKNLVRRADQYTPLQRACIYAGLAKAYDDIGDQETAFDYVAKQGDIRKEFHDYNPEHDIIYGGRMKLYFTPEVLDKHKDKGIETDNVAFIAGPPRSGTTLVEQILHAHPDIHGLGEDSTLNEYIAHNIDLGEERDIPYPFLIEDRYEGTKPNMSIHDAAQAYLDHVKKHIPDNTKCTVNKSLHNIEQIPMLLLCFPKAKIVYVKRNPLDACLSAYFKSFSPNAQTFSYDLSHLGQHYRVLYEMMDHWKTVFPDNIYEIEYEALVSDFETEAKKLVKAIGRDWDENCLKFYEAKRYIHTASVTQIRQPIYQSSVGRWKDYKDKLAPLAEALGPYCPEDY